MAGLTAESAGEGGPAAGRLGLGRRRRDGLVRLGGVDVALHRRRHQVVVVHGRVDRASLGHRAPCSPRRGAERSCHLPAAAAAARRM